MRENPYRRMRRAILTTTNVVCPRCKQERGSPCRTPAGRELRYPHAERITVWRSIGSSHFVQGGLPSLGKRR